MENSGMSAMEAEVVAVYKDTLNMSVTSRKLGISEYHVEKILKAHGIGTKERERLKAEKVPEDSLLDWARRWDELTGNIRHSGAGYRASFLSFDRLWGMLCEVREHGRGQQEHTGESTDQRMA